MDVSAPLLNAAMLALFTLILAWLGKGRFDALDRRIDRLEARMDRLEEHVEKRFERLEGQIADVRSDLTRIALALGTQPRPQTG